VHLRLFPDIPGTWRDDALAAKWDRVRQLRRVVTGAIEVERAEKRIGSSLESHAQVFAPAGDIQILGGIDLTEIAITSGITLSPGAVPANAFTIDDVAGVGVCVRRAEGQKCARCWKVLDEVGTDTDHPDVCDRCADAVRHLPLTST
jgi:isoleucyl-tRNA synthetase